MVTGTSVVHRPDLDSWLWPANSETGDPEPATPAPHFTGTNPNHTWNIARATYDPVPWSASIPASTRTRNP